MATDLFLVLGMAMLCLALPALLSAYSDERRPYAALSLLVLGGGVTVVATLLHPGGYTLRELPEVVYRVIGHYF